MRSYRDKNPAFLIRAADRIRELVPDFELIVLGAGPEEAVIRDAASRREWVHWEGPVFGDERAKYFALAAVTLVPSAVGLVVLDAFALETPLVTTTADTHGPEIGYLCSGENGVIVGGPPDPLTYAETVARLLADDSAREVLRAGCRTSAALYTIDGMAERFARGVLRALAM